jgi:hypothetical protein
LRESDSLSPGRVISNEPNISGSVTYRIHHSWNARQGLHGHRNSYPAPEFSGDISRWARYFTSLRIDSDLHGIPTKKRGA